MKSRTIISVGGSIIIPPKGFDISFLKELRKIILARVMQGEKFVLIAGGGSTARNYLQTASQVTNLSNDDLDWIGINATWLNAEFLRRLFGNWAYREVVKDPSKPIKTSKAIIVAGGWKPGNSTDYVAVKLAEQYKAKELINMSNISYVYTADPKIDKKAKKLPYLNWAEMKKIVGNKWVAGRNVPMDPSAVRLAAKLKLRILFVKGSNLKQLTLALEGEKIYGSVIK